MKRWLSPTYICLLLFLRIGKGNGICIYNFYTSLSWDWRRETDLAITGWFSIRYEQLFQLGDTFLICWWFMDLEIWCELWFDFYFSNALTWASWLNAVHGHGLSPRWLPWLTPRCWNGRGWLLCGRPAPRSRSRRGFEQRMATCMGHNLYVGERSNSDLINQHKPHQ